MWMNVGMGILMIQVIICVNHVEMVAQHVVKAQLTVRVVMLIVQNHFYSILTVLINVHLKLVFFKIIHV